jgi:hypothetical protein
MSRTHHHSRRHSVIRNPLLTQGQSKDAIHLRANGLLENSRYYVRNITMLNRRVQQGKVTHEVANRIRPSIVAQTFRDMRLPLQESRLLMRSIGM